MILIDRGEEKFRKNHMFSNNSSRGGKARCTRYVVFVIPALRKQADSSRVPTMSYIAAGGRRRDASRSVIIDSLGYTGKHLFKAP